MCKSLCLVFFYFFVCQFTKSVWKALCLVFLVFLCDNLLLQKNVPSLCENTVFLCVNLIEPSGKGLVSPEATDLSLAASSIRTVVESEGTTVESLLLSLDKIERESCELLRLQTQDANKSVKLNGESSGFLWIGVSTLIGSKQLGGSRSFWTNIINNKNSFKI